MKKWGIILGILVIFALIVATASAGKLLNKNPGFEQISNKLPTGWQWVGWLKPEVKFASDLSVKHSGKASASIEITKLERLKKFGPPNWAQEITTNIPKGKKVRLTGYIKAKDVKGMSAIAIQCWPTKNGKFLAFETTQTKTPISGTCDWKKVSLEMKVPKDTNKMRILCMLAGTGKVWFDDVKLEVIE